MTTSFLYMLWCSQVILEVLPISSSGHLQIISRYFLKKREEIPEYIEHIFHVPTAIIISVFLWIHKECLLKDVSMMQWSKLLVLVLFADLVTAICFLIVREKRKHFPLWLGFMCTMGILFAIRSLGCGGHLKITALQAAGIGLAQGVALLPGISRLAMTYTVGCLLGLAPAVAFMFSLAIQLPLIAGAVAKACYKVIDQREEKFPISIVGICAVILSSCAAYGMLEIIFSLMVKHATGFLAWYMLIPLMLAFLSAKKPNIK
jgi:undecaprenyl-diphosphatase